MSTAPASSPSHHVGICGLPVRGKEAGARYHLSFWLDAALGSISLSPESITDIIVRVDTFLSRVDRQPPLRDWQKLAGHLNWMLNVLPWARPVLTELYRKMKGKAHANAKVFLNREVIEDLT
jgi:hypothetical protein